MPFLYSDIELNVLTEKTQNAAKVARFLMERRVKVRGIIIEPTRIVVRCDDDPLLWTEFNAQLMNITDRFVQFEAQAKYGVLLQFRQLKKNFDARIAPK